MMSRPTPVIDLFAGPGGLGEGFSAATTTSGNSAFKIALSIEKDPIAHQTLTLRSFFRQFAADEVPDEYYHRLQRKLTTAELFNLYPAQSGAAREEAWQATLSDKRNAAQLRSRVRHALNNQDPWVLIGGPPCQAYSLAGRSRNKGIKDYVFADDPRTKLYVEYLQLIADFWPAVFVMQNVKGLLSAQVDGQSVFDQITQDLSDAATAVSRLNRNRARGARHTYTLHAITTSGVYPTPADFLVRSEQFGIPQARHRIIIVGVRNDLAQNKRLGILAKAPAPSVEEMIADLPRLRSGLSKESDDASLWTRAVLETPRRDVSADVGRVLRELRENPAGMFKADRDEEFIAGGARIKSDWFVDPRIRGFCYHSTRSHIRTDIRRRVCGRVSVLTLSEIRLFRSRNGNQFWPAVRRP